jgi:SPP1 family predicted phage head-tail adaptor
MSAGQLRYRVSIQNPVATQDDAGQPSTGWTTSAMAWADIRYQTGLSAIKSGVDVSVSRVSIRLRHGPFNAGQRVVYGTKVFNVLAVQPDSRQQYVDLICEALNVQS